VKAALVLALLAGCAADEVIADQPPYGDSERIGSSSPDGKSDGASPMTVRARTTGYRNNDNTVCYDTGYEIEVDYANTSLPWGVKVELVSAMQGVEWWPDDVNNTYHYDYFDWKYQEYAAMPAAGPWLWRGARKQWNYYGGGSFSAMHFAVKITYPDGGVRWDNGGSAWGYYRVTPPPAPCDPSWTPFVDTTPTKWESVTPLVVQKW